MTRLKTLLAPLLALLVVTAMTGSATAGGTDCEEGAGAKIVSFIASGGLIGNVINDQADDCWRYGDIDESDGSELAAEEGYTHILSVADSNDVHNATMGNRLENAKSIAWSEAKYEAVQEMNDGASKSVAKFEAEKAAEEYYAALQYNQIQVWNNWVLQVQAANASGSHTGDLYAYDPTEGNVQSALWNDQYPITFGTRNYTLVNGTDVEVMYVSPSQNNDNVDPADGYDGEYLKWDHPTESDSAMVLRDDSTEWALSTIEQQEQSVSDQMDTFIENVYANYSAGELNSSDLLSPRTIARKAGTDANTTGSSQYVAIELAALGYSGDLNSTFTVEVNGTLYNGTLFYTGDDLDQLQNGTTYDVGGDAVNRSGDPNGTFIMAVQQSDGTADTIEWGDDERVNVTIVEMRDADTGETINNTTVKQYTYQTANASKLANEISVLQQLVEEYREAGSGGAGGTGGSGGIPWVPLAGVGGVVALVALLNRDDETGRGGRGR